MTGEFRKDVKRLTKEIDRLRHELAVERGEKPVGEMIVMRSGTQWAAPDTFHVTLAISRPEIGRDKHREAKIDTMLEFAKQQILAELGTPRT